MLKEFGLWEDVLRVKDSRKIRTGRSKVRGGRYTQRKGPLFIVGNEGS